MKLLISTFALLIATGMIVRAGNPWVVYEGKEGPGKGKHVVLVSGDEEYRSEEALPQLGKILSVHHGFKCTVLFAITDGYIDPNNRHNIPGLEALKDADLMVIATRFRDLPDEQMKPIDDYLNRGGPVIGMRTATHAFNIGKGKAYSHYSFRYKGEKKLWTDGFGRMVLGETWISHHGHHKVEATRGVIADDAKDHPIARGCEDVFGPTDVYGVRLPLPGDSKPIIMGQVLVGMKPTDKPLEGKKNDPIMPIAWTKSYKTETGKKGQVFTTTMGAANDLPSEGVRRMLVNAVYHLTGLDVPKRAKVEIVGAFKGSMYGFRREKDYYKNQNMKPSDFELKD